MNRFEAMSFLLDAFDRCQPGEYAQFIRETLALLGYANLDEAFDDLLEIATRRTSETLH